MISDDELNQLLAPARQIHTGPVIDPDPISRHLATTGQLNPVFERHFDVQNGRYLSGLGEIMQQRTDNVDRPEHDEIFDLEDQDDVLGSGIFDPERRPATANANVGVFASHYSLPGYHAREIPFAVNTEITDLTADAAVVGIPSGGLNYVEAQGMPQGYAQYGADAPSMQLTPAPLTNQYEPYAELGIAARPNRWDVDGLLSKMERQGEKNAPGQPIQAPKPGGMTTAMVPAGSAAPPAKTPPAAAPPAPPFYDRHRPVALSPTRPGPDWPSHPARQPLWNVQQVPSRPQNLSVPGRPAERPVAQRATFTPTGPSLVIPPAVASAKGAIQRAMGALPEGTFETVAFLGAGVAAGIALRMLFGGKKKG